MVYLVATVIPLFVLRVLLDVGRCGHPLSAATDRTQGRRNWACRFVLAFALVGCAASSKPPDGNAGMDYADAAISAGGFPGTAGSDGTGGWTTDTGGGDGKGGEPVESAGAPATGGVSALGGRTALVTGSNTGTASPDARAPDSVSPDSRSPDLGGAAGAASAGGAGGASGRGPIGGSTGAGGSIGTGRAGWSPNPDAGPSVDSRGYWCPPANDAGWDWCGVNPAGGETCWLCDSQVGVLRDLLQPCPWDMSASQAAAYTPPCLPWSQTSGCRVGTQADKHACCLLANQTVPAVCQ